jgi:DNA-binding transcriptional ArsR family regulator
MKTRRATCGPNDHATVQPAPPPASLERAARLFRALADAPRLRTLELLAGRELCVTAIAGALGDKLSTVSQRLRLLRQEGLVARRRDGNHLYYALADRHVAGLLRNALAHAQELDAEPPRRTLPGDD